MPPPSIWPVELVSVGDAPSACAAVAWRVGDELRITVVVKATFGVVPDGEARAVAPPPIVVRDVYFRDDPRRSLRMCSETAPYLAQAEVLLAGHAYALPQRPVTSLTARLAVLRGTDLIFDKAVIVAGERGSRGELKPFQHAPLLYELARFDPELNPVGVPPERGEPRIFSPRSPTHVAGMGPLSRTWPARARALGGAPPGPLEGLRLDIPPGVDWGYFQASPADQRMDFLQGDETIVLSGLHPTLPVARTRLPGVTPRARVYRDGAPQQDLALFADTLAVDTDQQTLTVVFRNNITVRDEDLPHLAIHAGIELPGRPVVFAAEAVREEVRTLGMTARVDTERAQQQPVLPFDPSAPPAVPPNAPRVRPPPPPAHPLDEATRTGFVVLPTGDLPFSSAQPATLPGGAPAPSLPFVPANEPPADTPAYVERPTAILDEATPFRPSFSDEPTPYRASVVDEPTPFRPSFSDEATPFQGDPSTVDGPFVEPDEDDDDDEMNRTFGLDPAENARLAHGLPFEAAPPATTASPAAPPPGSPWAPPGAPVQAPRIFIPEEHTSTGFINPALLAASGGLPPPTVPSPLGADAGPPGVPERVGDNVPVYNTSPFAAVAVPFQVRPPRDSLTVVVKGTFRLVPDGPATPLDEPDIPTGDVFSDDDFEKSLIYPSDLAVFKARADVVFLGHAVAPGGASKAAEVRVSFGRDKNRIQRKLAVFGERMWDKSLLAAVPTAPRPFERIPLVAERAFGGPGLDANPAGVGYKGAAGADGVPRLPNIEDPDRLIKAPSDKPQPALIGALSPFWKERWSKIGTYDAKWVKTRWPYFAEDFDWSFFQCAPERQRVDYLVGDEPFELTGMSASHPRLSGTLPGLQARAFMQHTKDAGETFEEVLLRLDTAVFDVDNEKLILVWRGLIEVADDDAPEVAALFVMAEPLSGPRSSVEEAKKRFEIALVPLEEVEDSPEAETEPANEVEPKSPEEEAADALIAEQQAKLDALNSVAGSEPSPVTEPAGADPQAMAASLRAAGVDEAEIAAMIEAVSAPAEPAPALPRARAIVEEHLARGEPLDGLDLHGGDLTGLDLSGRSLIGVDLRAARLAGVLFTGANLSAALLSEADLAGANFEAAILDEADLSETNAVDAVFSGARLPSAVLDGARADKARFTGASAPGASFVGAQLAGARFDDAVLNGADFTRATLQNATFFRAKANDVMFYDVEAEGVSFEEAELVDARLDGAKMARSTFKKARAKGSIWERALLEEASFLGAELPDASFVRVRAGRAKFSGADLSQAVLRRAKMPAAELFKANLMGATVERADLTHADLRSANLHGAETWKAKLDGAQLDFALITKTKLKGGP